jgi:hypothetical protein
MSFCEILQPVVTYAKEATNRRHCADKLEELM